MEYRKEYADYWTQADRRGARSSTDLRPIAAQIVRSCGIGNVLDVGSGMGFVVQRLLREGIDARGVDVAPRVVEACNARMPDRFTSGSILELPFSDGSFETVISIDCLEHIAPEDIPKALAELNRVCRRSLFLRITTKIDRDGRWRLSIHNRDWWERQLLGCGFRKHPRYYAVLPYEELEHDPEEITIVMEMLPAKSERLDTDMLRDQPGGEAIPMRIRKCCIGRDDISCGVFSGWIVKAREYFFGSSAGWHSTFRCRRNLKPQELMDYLAGVYRILVSGRSVRNAQLCRSPADRRADRSSLWHRQRAGCRQWHGVGAGYGAYVIRQKFAGR